MKKYYADIKLLFDESKYSIVGDSSVGKKDMVDLVKSTVKELNHLYKINSNNILNDKGNIIGNFKIYSKEF